MSAHDDAMNWLRGQWYSEWQINDAIGKVRQQQNSGMSRSDIMSNVRNDSSSYFGWAPMYGSSSSWGWENEHVPTWEELHPARTTNMGWKEFSLQTHEDWSVTVTTWGRPQTINAKDNKSLYDTIMNHYNWLSSKQTNKNPNMTSNESGIWDQVAQTRDRKQWENFDNAYDYYIKELWLSPEEAFKKASAWVERDTISSSKKDKEAEEMWPSTSDEDTSTTPVDMNSEVINGEEESSEANSESNIEPNDDVMNLNWEEMTPDEYIDKLFERMFGSNVTESNVIENKAEVSKDPIFDYQTYFRENLSAPKDQWVTWQVENKIEKGPLTNVKKYDEETTQALQNLWFLQPDSEAAATMPDTVEQTEVKAVENPEQLVQEFDWKMDEMANTTGITPQAAAQTYMDYKNQLAKYIRENKISDEEAAAMFDQLKNNEKFRALLTQWNK